MTTHPYALSFKLWAYCCIFGLVFLVCISAASCVAQEVLIDVVSLGVLRR